MRSRNGSEYWYIDCCMLPDWLYPLFQYGYFTKGGLDCEKEMDLPHFDGNCGSAVGLEIFRNKPILPRGYAGPYGRILH